jgi:hypothetical protein
MRTDKRGRPRRIAAAGLLWGVIPWSILACDFEVTNPGPVQDEQLNAESAQQALVNGAGRALSTAVGWLAYTGGVAALEVQGSGNITQFGVTLKQRAGDLAPEQGETDEHWQLAHQARWVAEEAVRRMERAFGAQFDSHPLAATGLLYAGYANRLLGENMCVAVIDGGPAQDRRIHFERAEDAFSRALAIAQAAQRPDLAAAALAGRASVRAWLGDWQAVVADAQQVAEDFVFHAHYSDIEIDQYNRIYWAGANSPFRAVTVWSTYFESYFEQTGDPRTPWTTVPDYPTGDGSDIPFLRQMKYTERDSPIRLSSGREMRLLVAEARLRENDWQTAASILNDLRTKIGLPTVQTNDLAETWTLLRRERAAELWLEARHLGDVFRWEQEGAAGQPIQDLTGRDRCFPIGQTEIDTNPNISGELG